MAMNPNTRKFVNLSAGNYEVIIQDLRTEENAIKCGLWCFPKGNSITWETCELILKDMIEGNDKVTTDSLWKKCVQQFMIRLEDESASCAEQAINWRKWLINHNAGVNYNIDERQYYVTLPSKVTT